MANLFGDVYNTLGGGNISQGQSAYQQAVAALQAAVPPNLQNMVPQLALQMVQGTMTPAQASAAVQAQSVANGITPDPQAVQAQSTALSQLQQVASSGGMTAMDKAQLQDMNNQVNAQNVGRQGAIAQQMQSQGVGGSGADLAARLAAGQTANETAGQNAVTVAGNAQARALQAMQAAGNLGSNIQQENFGEDLQKAQAQNQINQFNTQNQQATALTNANNTQAANLANFNTANTVAGTNTNIQNTQNLLPLQTAVTQQNLNEQNAQGQSTALQNEGANSTKLGTQEAAGTANAIGALASNAPAIASGIGNAYDAVSGWLSDPSLKKDKSALSDQDIDAMLEKISGYKYSYDRSKAPNAPKGKQMGVMSDDMARSGMADVAHTDDGKDVVVDNDMLKGHMVAALANLGKRVREMECK